MASIFNKIPIRDNYKDPEDDELKLKAPPLVVRTCFVMEMLIAGLAFGLSYYVSSTSTVTEVEIGFELDADTSNCDILSPRNDAYFFDDDSDMVQFSNAQYNSDDCKEALSSAYNNVCGTGNRQDFAITTRVVTATDDNCYDLPLADGFRFCYGRERDETLLEDIAESSFPYEAQSPDAQFDEGFYFMNADGSITTVSVPFSANDLLSTFVPDATTGLYLYAVVSNPAELTNDVYQLSAEDGAVEVLMSIDVSPSFIYGLTAAGDYVFSYVVDQGSGDIYAYNLATKTEESIFSVDCGNVDNEDAPGTDYPRYITSTENGIVYAMCTSAIGEIDSRDYNPYAFYKIDWLSGTSTTYCADISNTTVVSASADDIATPSMSYIHQIFGVGSTAYVDTGPPYYNLLAIDLTPQPTLIPSYAPTFRPTNSSEYASPSPTSSGPSPKRQPAPRSELKENKNRIIIAPRRYLTDVTQPVVSLGNYTGSYMSFMDITGVNSGFYFHDGGQAYYSINSAEFGVFAAGELNSDYTYTTAVEIGFTYGTCDNDITRYTVDASLASSFSDQCGEKNGYYYQNHQWITVPAICAGSLTNIAADEDDSGGMASIKDCDELNTLVYEDYIKPTCDASIKEVCEQAFDDNPPFSCTTVRKLEFFTVLGTALANASALWSFWVIIIGVSLKKLYPQGVMYRDYVTKPADKTGVVSPAVIVPVNFDVDEAEGEGEGDEEYAAEGEDTHHDEQSPDMHNSGDIFPLRGQAMEERDGDFDLNNHENSSVAVGAAALAGGAAGGAAGTSGIGSGRDDANNNNNNGNRSKLQHNTNTADIFSKNELKSGKSDFFLLGASSEDDDLLNKNAIHPI